MKPRDEKYLDSRIQQGMRGTFLGVQAPTGEKARLLMSATNVGGDSLGRKLKPDWLSASVARQMREKRRSVDGIKYSHLVSGSNLRFAW